MMDGMRLFLLLLLLRVFYFRSGSPLVVHSFYHGGKLITTNHGQIGGLGQDTSHAVAKGKLFLWKKGTNEKVMSAWDTVACYSIAIPAHAMLLLPSIRSCSLTFLMLIVNDDAGVAVEDGRPHVISNHVAVEVRVHHSTNTDGCVG